MISVAVPFVNETYQWNKKKQDKFKESNKLLQIMKAYKQLSIVVIITCFQNCYFELTLNCDVISIQLGDKAGI